ncbi:DMT family transporter [Paenibacillus puldeungensis]|uniref:DMT family transporter n=1 Tax=Paenibacillus puldeungensis TaxID=696536 RepID=A0ABW3S0Y8_9BACL
MQTQSLKLAYWAVIVNAVIVGFSFLFTKVAIEFADPMDTLTFRFAASFAVILIPFIFGRLTLNFRGKSLVKPLLLAAIYPLGFFVFQTFGLQYATSSEGGILYAFTPVLTMLLAFLFLKESTTLLQKLSIALSIFGVVFILVMKGSGFSLSNTAGIILLSLSCLAFAGYSVLARSMLKTYRPVEITFLTQGIGFTVFLVISLTNHVTTGTIKTFFTPLASGSFILSVLYLGVLSSLITALTANYALSKLEASRVSVFTSLSTVVSIAAGALLLGEEIRLYHIIGSVLIIVGVIGTNQASRKAEKHPDLG